MSITFAFNVLVLKVAQGPGDGKRAVHAVDHDRPAGVLYPLLFGWDRWLVIQCTDGRRSFSAENCPRITTVGDIKMLRRDEDADGC